ncbi:putative serine esterase-domain-containing protein [Lipomyces kononenkoae]|uniref:Serine esterase-domain-containing protein n=1 Tax=Lipomyces kononenkoae TaxID=34357 RepID=A0ACC3T770_LIPKO
MLLFRTRSSVKVGQLHRYIITYVPAHDNVFPLPMSLYLRVRNTELFPMRAAYLNGPFVLYVDVKPSHYDPAVKVTNPYDKPSYEPQVKASQSYYAELKLDPTRTEHSWTIDVVSQLIFSSSATVAFEMSIGRNHDSLHIDAEDGIFSNCLTVTHLDTSAIWSTPQPDSDKDLHLVVVSHGLHSNTGADMLFLKEQIDKAARHTGENIIVRGYFDNVCRTERGVKYLGKRMAQYIATSLREPNVKKISFIGHSLGGLVMTYAIAFLHAHYPDFFDTIEPVNFIALATPFLGLSNENPLYVKFALDFGAVGKTGQDLGLTWKPASPFASSIVSKPLLRILPTGPAAEILKRFKRRTVYANAVNDGIVPLRTSALLYLDWRGLAKANQAQRGEKVAANSNSSSQVNIDKAEATVEGEQDATGEIEEQIVDNGQAVLKSPMNRNHTYPSHIFAEAFKPLQSTLSLLRSPQIIRRRPSKIYNRSQTLNIRDVDDGEGDDKLVPLPRTSVFESVPSLLNPPLPPEDFILDINSRPTTIFHDRIYSPEDLPHQQVRRQASSTLSSESDLAKQASNHNASSKVEKARVEEKIARSWHDNMTWRKVLVQLEPDAHNNIIVRRTFANAYGWPVIQHLIEHHFVNPYDPEKASAATDNRAEVEVIENNDAQAVKSEMGDLGQSQLPMSTSLERGQTHDSLSSGRTTVTSWDDSAFVVSEDEYDEDDEAHHIAVQTDTVASSSTQPLSETTAAEYSYQQQFSGFVNYLSEWSPMRLYSGMAGNADSSKGEHTITPPRTPSNRTT